MSASSSPSPLPLDTSQLLAAAERGSSLWRDAWLRLRKNRMAVAGGVAVLCLMGLCFLAPFIAPYSFDEQDLDLGAARPGSSHWLGTDTLGRDLFTRLL